MAYDERMTRRRLLFRELPLATAAVVASGILAAQMGFDFHGVLTDNIERKRSANGKVRSDVLIKSVVKKHWYRYFASIQDEFHMFCEKNMLGCSDVMVQRWYATARLLHEIVRHGGILGNRYELADGREKEILLAGRARMIGAKEHKGRYPAKMLRDMLSEKPGYAYASGERIHSFGDCDELEMVYVNMLRSCGMKAVRIVMTAPNHVETVVFIGGMEFLVDNSFGKFGRERTCRNGCRDYVAGRGGYKNPEDAKKYIRFVNRKAVEHAVVFMSNAAAGRVESTVLSHIQNLKKAAP